MGTLEKVLQNLLQSVDVAGPEAEVAFPWQDVELRPGQRFVNLLRIQPGG